MTPPRKRFPSQESAKNRPLLKNSTYLDSTPDRGQINEDGVTNLQNEESTVNVGRDDIRLLGSTCSAERVSSSDASIKVDEPTYFSARATNKARSSGATLFDSKWLRDIKRRGQSHDTVCARNRRTRRAEPNINGSIDESMLDDGGVGKTSSATSAAKVDDGNQIVDADSAVEASHSRIRAEENGDGDGNEEVKTVLVYRRWQEDEDDILLTNSQKKTIEDVLEHDAGHAARRVAVKNFKRPWHPSQWECFQAYSTSAPVLQGQGCRLEPTDRSKVKVSKSLIGRVGTVAALEKTKVPPVLEESPRDGQDTTLTGQGERKCSGRPHAAPPAKNNVSTYLSIKAEQIRCRRDHEAWHARFLSGDDTPMKDPMSLLGDCLEGFRRLKEKNKAAQACRRVVAPTTTHTPGCSDQAGRTRVVSHGKALDLCSLSRARSSTCSAGATVADDRSKALRRQFLSEPHLENLLMSARSLLSDEAESEARQGIAQRMDRARIRGYLFGHSRRGQAGQKRNIGDKVEGVLGEPALSVEAFALGCLAESRRIV